MKILPTGPATTTSSMEPKTKHERNEMAIVSNVTLIDCQDVVNAGYTETGVYEIYPEGLPYGTPVWCEVDGNTGWTVFQRRMDGSQDFHLYWEDYKRGFGNINGEFWLGNEAVHLITTRIGRLYELHIDLQREDNDLWYYVKYSDFKITNEDDNYRLLYNHFIEGTADDDLAYQNNMQFTTRDRDNDLYTYNCADFEFSVGLTPMKATLEATMRAQFFTRSIG
ncbi:ficolin-1-like [Saccoglossus kowalevskii]|uniref:Ficolin-1-like n=1 Tax=Saccoglossus kowalevskii TaxID=10224 RepID=A0ABM0MIZ2_SACKO|nr:PREDICTED: ficolin-1-like [Saccoglossus kowalevskii]